MSLREFRFEIKGTLGEEDEEKAKALLELALKQSWLFQDEGIIKIEAKEVFPVYNV